MNEEPAPSSAFDIPDPAGLVARSPELALLARKSPSLRRAIERGRPLEAYRALYWAYRFGKLGTLRDRAATLLEHRRVFLKPITGAPGLFTVNGVGTMLYGRADMDGNDGTYVATLFLVLVFVPIFPLSSYLVADGNPRGWRFFAKVPLGTFPYLWQRGLALLAVAMMLSGVASAYGGFRNGSLHVVNGLARAVTVKVSGGKTLAVPAGGTSEIATTVGEHAITVEADGKTLEAGTVDVPRGRTSVAVWNVAGAAPVYSLDVTYGPSAPATAGGPEPTVHCGETAIVESNVDYAFTTPPERISTSQKSGTLRKRRIDVGPGGMSTCLKFSIMRAVTAKSAEGAAAEARRALGIAEASRAPAATLVAGDVGEALARVPAVEAERFARDLIARDDSVDAHRMMQDVLIESNQRERAVTEYAARLAAHPSGDAEYLALRPRPTRETLPLIEAAVARYPESAMLRRTQAFVYQATWTPARALEACEAIRRLDRTRWQDLLDLHVESLVALQRGDEALTLARGVADSGAAEETRRGAALLVYRVRHALGMPRVEIAAPAEDDGLVRPFAHAAAGEELTASDLAAPKESDAKEALRIAADVRASPDAALSKASGAGLHVVGKLPPVMRYMLLGEAIRRGESRDLLEKLSVGARPRFLDAAIAYVTAGTLSEDIDAFPLELRAALDLARSRVRGLSPKERASVVERARKADPLRGPVTAALDGWPA